MMTQTRSKNTPLFQTSLRDWQASWKAKQAAAQESEAPALAAAPREKKFIAYKRRKQKQLAAGEQS